MAESVAERVEKLIGETVKNCDVSLWDVEFVKEGPTRTLRVTIDKEEGIDITDCEKVHRAIDPVLDEADPIDVSYQLEVTSPGLERVLRRPEHFLSSIGEKVSVSLFAKQNDAKHFSGKLIAFDPESASFSVETEQGILTFASENVSKVRTVFEF